MRFAWSSVAGLVWCALFASPAVADISSLLFTCADGETSADQIVQTASTEFEFRKADIPPGQVRMARSEARIVDLIARAKSEEAAQIILETKYPSGMRRAANALTWTSRDDSEHVGLVARDGTNLIVWKSTDSSVVGCLFLTFEPTIALELPPEFSDAFGEKVSMFGSTVKYHLPSGIAGSVSHTKPTSEFAEYFPSRPKTTSVLLISTRRSAEAS